jgi:TM2 domain-containing membrane protein YozV
MTTFDANTVPTGYNQKSRACYILLALFMGGIGAHEFYRGATANGFKFAIVNFIMSTWLFTGMVEEAAIYYVPLFTLLGMFIYTIKLIVTQDRDANGVLMK